MRRAGLIVISVLLASGFAFAQDWPTYQGDARRSGCPDGRPLPARVKVLWVLPGNSHYLAAPAVSAGRLILPALGAFNAAGSLGFIIGPLAGGAISQLVAADWGWPSGYQAAFIVAGVSEMLCVVITLPFLMRGDSATRP